MVDRKGDEECRVHHKKIKSIMSEFANFYIQWLLKSSTLKF